MTVTNRNIQVLLPVDFGAVISEDELWFSLKLFSGLELLLCGLYPENCMFDTVCCSCSSVPDLKIFHL